MTKKILIPVYNDWSSVRILLNKLEKSLKPGRYEVVIVNDFSKEEEKFNLKKLKKIKKLSILNLVRNVGSQNCIAIWILRRRCQFPFFLFRKLLGELAL